MSLMLKLPLGMVIFLGLLVVGQPFFLSVAVGAPAARERCEDCHKDLYDGGLRRRFIHMPFQEKKCRQCHVAGESRNDGARLRVKKKRNIEKVKWLGESLEPAMNHFFLLSDNVVDRTILVEIGVDGRIVKRDKIVIPSLGSIKMVADDRIAPKIKDVKVLEVERGLYIEAGIGWQTDEPATSGMKYGLNKLDNQVPESNRLTTDHKVSLTGLKKDQEYRFEVFSEDRFGNVSKAGPFTFSTKGAVYGHGMSLGARGSGDDIKLIHGVTRNNDRLVLNVSANKSVSISIGSIGDSQATVGSKGGKAQKKTAAAHPKLKNKREVNIRTCYTCHNKTEGGQSHPINIRARNGMIIPREYPTLPDGRMTCMSCHADHASNFPYRLIKSTKKELCLGCHKGLGG